MKKCLENSKRYRHESICNVKMESRQLKNFSKAKFLEDLKRVYWDILVDHDDSTIAAQFWTRVFVGMHLLDSGKAKIFMRP